MKKEVIDEKAITEQSANNIKNAHYISIYGVYIDYANKDAKYMEPQEEGNPKYFKEKVCSPYMFSETAPDALIKTLKSLNLCL